MDTDYFIVLKKIYTIPSDDGMMWEHHVNRNFDFLFGSYLLK